MFHNVLGFRICFSPSTELTQAHTTKSRSGNSHVTQAGVAKDPNAEHRATAKTAFEHMPGESKADVRPGLAVWSASGSQGDVSASILDRLSGLELVRTISNSS